MTRLEALFAHMDEEVDESGEYAFDPMLFVKAYLAERDDFVIGATQTGHNYMRADTARMQLQLEQRGRASEFDNAEVDETPDKAQEAFDAMFADSLGALAKL